MPPPSDCSKISIQSTVDHAAGNDFDKSRSELSDFVQAQSNLDLKSTLKNETIGFVKTLLGPSLEDAVLKTLEFGKTIIQKQDGYDSVLKDKKLFETLKKEFSDDPQKQLNLSVILDKQKKNAEMKEDIYLKENASRKSVTFDKEKGKNAQVYQKTKKPIKKLANVSKIRSLDSDLKQRSLSPEKIKKQLEALIQINKDVPPEHAFSWNYCSKKNDIPVEMTVMPSICMYKTGLNTPSSCEIQSNTSKLDCKGDPTTSKTQSRRRQPKICQAPEFISNALGPTLDVSLIDNIKMMRDIFKCDSARGEEVSKRPPICQEIKQEVRFQNSETEMTCRIDELHKKIEELEQKERCLAKQIEDEELERENKRMAFKEEQKKLCEIKSFSEIIIDRKKECGTPLMETCFEAKLESLQKRIACEEEKLSKLKAQSDNYKREITEAKNKIEVFKKNKTLLDAWDVFASRVCHTRLPSFSRIHTLERKDFNTGETGNLHCCFPVVNPPACESTKSTKNQSRCSSNLHCPCSNQSFRKNESQCPSRCPSRSESRCCDRDTPCKDHCKKESVMNVKCKIKLGEIMFPVQRDITCGLHQIIKICSCNTKSPMKHEGHEGHPYSSEDELFRRYKAMDSGNKKEHFFSSLALDSSAELIAKKVSKEKVPCRSKSDTSLKKEKCSRIVKVMWATTRINIFQDNCRTYEIMDATSNAPACLPAKTEGIFVVKTPQKKVCPSFSRRKCQPSVP